LISRALPKELVAPFKPREIGVAFDIGHALVVHKDEWVLHFEKLKSHLQIAYVKDPGPQGDFVPFGAGLVAQTDFFKRLKAMGYNAPISMHIEFDWSNKRASMNRAALLKTLKTSTAVVRSWMATV
jgi:sugar phosphate isomerase/epimerase